MAVTILHVIMYDATSGGALASRWNANLKSVAFLQQEKGGDPCGLYRRRPQSHETPTRRCGLHAWVVERKEKGKENKEAVWHRKTAKAVQLSEDSELSRKSEDSELGRSTEEEDQKSRTVELDSLLEKNSKLI